MKAEKKLYKNAEIDIVLLSASDIVTESTAGDGFDFVDGDAWDQT